MRPPLPSAIRTPAPLLPSLAQPSLAQPSLALLSLALSSLALVSQPALAADSASGALAVALEQAPTTPMVAMACAPSDTVLTTLAQIVETMGTEGLDPAGRRLVASLLSPGGPASLGIDPDGALGLTLWSLGDDPEGVLSLPFAGDRDAALGVFEVLGYQVEALADSRDSWRLQSDDGVESLAHLRDGALDFAFEGGGADASGPLPDVDLPLVEGLPPDPGCALWMAMAADSVPGPERLKTGKGLAMAGFIPFGRGSLGLVRLRPGGDLPRSLQQPPAAPVSGSSLEAPALVLSLGISLGDILADPVVQGALDLSPRVARRAGRWLNVGAGATVALFGDPRTLDLVANLPLDPQAGPTSQRRVIKRLRRLARKADVVVLERTEDGLVIQLQETKTLVAVRDGRVVVGPRFDRVIEAADGQGRAWVTPTDLAWALQWPVSLWTGPEGPMAGGVDISVRAGLRTQQEILELGLQVQTNAPPGLITSFLAAVLSQGRVAGGRPEGPPVALAGEDLERAMEGIALAQEVHRSVSGSYLALPPAPRRLEDIDAQAVPWKAGDGWKRLGWSPTPPLTAAVFWVELSGDGQGYTVHAEADLDGDGERAHYVRTSSQPMQRTSPDGVE